MSTYRGAYTYPISNMSGDLYAKHMANTLKYENTFYHTSIQALFKYNENTKTKEAANS